MAEVLIPAIGLAGMYAIITENKNKNKENFTSRRNVPPGLESTLDNTRSRSAMPRVKQVMHPNTPFDNLSEAVVTKLGGHDRTVGLTGETISAPDFKHNNMIPYFGAKITGPRVDIDANASILDSKAGAGSQLNHKRENAPLFAPQKKMSWTNGMPAMTEFYRSRTNPSTRAANVKPWEEIKVAPGLGQGYTTGNNGSGYNTAVEDRQAWMPKGVNMLRTTNNPKQTYTLDGLEGAASSSNKVGSNKTTIGVVEKNRPKTDYELGEERWFKTTGAHKASRFNSHQMLAPQHRAAGGREYYGSTSGGNKSTYTKGVVAECSKQQLQPLPPGISAPPNGSQSSDYGRNPDSHLTTNRAAGSQPDARGPLGSMVAALTAPVLDILRPSRKENAIGNQRLFGSTQCSTQGGRIRAPGATVKPTIREQTETNMDNSYLNVQANHQGGYQISNTQALPQHRETGSQEYSGIASAGYYKEPTNYSSAYNQQTVSDRSAAGRINRGNTSTFNSKINMSLREGPRASNYIPGASGHNSAIIGAETTGAPQRTSQSNNYGESSERLDPNLLEAFKKNPFTHSLSSAV